MNMKFFLSGLLAVLSPGLLQVQAQETYLHPVPQACVEQKDSVVVPDSYRLDVDPAWEQLPAVKQLKAVLPGAQTEGKDLFTVSLGIKGDKAVKKYNRYIPKKAEGYFLKIDKDGIVIAASDRRGAYYGVQTLAQLLAMKKLPAMQITDFPDVPYRGVVEGFYGTPWSHEARLRQLDFYGRNKMNVYIYGPKDDPYHRKPNWRKPYPAEEARQLQELVDRAKENEVIFYWAIHPGQDIRWNDEDRDLLLQKFESMYQLGVRGFAVFFDDISGEGTKADKQAELLNYVDDHFVKVKKDVAPLILCPTEYNRSWAKLEGGYLATLGKKLNPGIQVMWTGDKVVTVIDKGTLDFVNPLIQRKAYIWWNYPVTDYVRNHILMGPVYGNDLDIAGDMAAFVSNPMEQAEASKIALYSIADYTWNMEAYDSEKSWQHAIEDLMPQQAEYLAVFAAHSADLGTNGHRFQREESVALAPALAALSDGFEKRAAVDAGSYRQVAEECDKIVVAADMLLASTENLPLIQEIEPWLIRFKLTGEYGREVLRMVKFLQEDKPENFVSSYRHARALQLLMHRVDTTYNQQARQKGIALGTKHLLPTFNRLFESAAGRYNEAYKATLDTRSEPWSQPKKK